MRRSDTVHRDFDVQRHNEQKEVMKAMLSKYKKMELRLETYEKTHAEMEEQARYVLDIHIIHMIVPTKYYHYSTSRRQIHTLDMKVKLLESQGRRRRSTPDIQTNALMTKLHELTEEITQLRNQNQELKEDKDDLDAMIEVLRGRGAARSPMVTGLVLPEGARSPVLSAVHSPVL